MAFSYYPMNLDLLYMIPLYFGNDIVPKFIHFAFVLLTAWLVFKYLSRRTNKGYGLLGALLFLSIVIIIKLSVTVYVDLGEIFFSFASFLFILEWLKNDFKIKSLLYSGIMCGLALGTSIMDWCKCFKEQNLMFIQKYSFFDERVKNHQTYHSRRGGNL